MHDRDAEHPTHALVEHRPGLCALDPTSLEAHDGSEDLQIVLHAMVDLSDHRHLALEFALGLQRLRRIMDQDQDSTIPRGRLSPPALQPSPQALFCHSLCPCESAGESRSRPRETVLFGLEL